VPVPSRISPWLLRWRPGLDRRGAASSPSPASRRVLEQVSRGQVRVVGGPRAYCLPLARGAVGVLGLDAADPREPAVSLGLGRRRATRATVAPRHGVDPSRVSRWLTRARRRGRLEDRSLAGPPPAWRICQICPRLTGVPPGAPTVLTAGIRLRAGRVRSSSAPQLSRGLRATPHSLIDAAEPAPPLRIGKGNRRGAGDHVSRADRFAHRPRAGPPTGRTAACGALGHRACDFGPRGHADLGRSEAEVRTPWPLTRDPPRVVGP